jgi:hypothetical protein
MGVSRLQPAGGANDFTLDIGSSGDTTFELTKEYAPGAYSITSQLADASLDVYIINADGSSAGYTNTKSLTATKGFNKMVVYGATTNDLLIFEYKTTFSPTDSGDVDDGAAPFLTSATPSTLAFVDDTTTVTGGNFASDVEIVFTGQDDVDRAAKNIVRSSSTSLIVTRPDVFPVEQEPYTMTATNAGLTNPSTNVNVLTDYFTAPLPTLEYLVIAGGGGGGEDLGSGGGGGGGAGGYRSSVTGESSGGGASAESSLEFTLGTNYTVTVGAGGPMSGNGANSVFSTITSVGGGAGGNNGQDGSSGGSGGGGGDDFSNGGSGTAGQGFSGGGADNTGGGGGGGASEPGVNDPSDFNGDGGDGVASSITGASIYRAGGGGGRGGAAGGLGGGAIGDGSSGVVNTGGGGGAGPGGAAGAGGSGVVILSYPSVLTLTVGAGLTADAPITVGANKVTVLTAGTGNVSWAA